MRTGRVILAFTGIALGLSSPALCADFLTSGGSARLAGSGGVYLPGSENVSDAMGVNPAGLALIGAPRIDLSVETGHAAGSFTSAVTPQGRLNATGVVPYGAFAAPLSGIAHRFTIGFAAAPELLSSARWRYTDPPGGAGQVSYGALNSVSAINAIRMSAGAGMYITSRLQVGVTVGATWNSNTLETAYVFQNFQPLAGLKTGLTLHTSGVGWNTSAGTLFRVSRSVNLGAAWHSRTTVRSTGTASGNAGVQFAAIGLGGARPDFKYDAEVDNILPQSASATVAWQTTSKLRVAAQMDWVNWSSAFRRLPVFLTHGDNRDINGLLGSDAIADSIPLDWHDQFIERVGIERKWLERATLRAGYSHSGTPVPSSTLSPLTAAITRHSFSAGAGYDMGRWRLDGAWTLDPRTTERVGQSALRSGEFSNTVVRVSTQAVILSASLRL